MTLYCHEKTQKAMALKGFLDIRSLLALKQKDQCEQECECELEHECTLGAGGLDSSNFLMGPSHIRGHGTITCSGCAEEEGGQSEEGEGRNRRLTADCMRNTACTDGLSDPIEPQLYGLGKPTRVQRGRPDERVGQGEEDDVKN